ncbi:hypothetical protein, partial [Tenacibaculum maritimum]|uniref:hypothetical protein n=1 Tax=Tenacibaculum maritimum TaxID=107401 RepID=UPI0038767CC7
QINQDIGSKVDKVDGKELSSNDYTDTDKTKLNSLNPLAFKTISDGYGNNIVAEAQDDELTIEGVTVDSATKKVTVNVPKKVSELTNDAFYTTKGDPIISNGGLFKTIPLQAAYQMGASQTDIIKITPPYLNLQAFFIEVQINGFISGVGVHPITLLISCYLHSSSDIGVLMASPVVRCLTDDVTNDFPVRFVSGERAAIYIGNENSNFHYSVVSITKMYGKYVGGALTDDIMKRIQNETNISSVANAPTTGVVYNNNLIQGKTARIAIKDKNDVTKFELTDSLSFDDHFKFNSAEKQVELNVNALRVLTTKNSNPLGMYFIPSNINSFKEVVGSIGSVFSSSGIHLMTFNFTFQPRASFGSGKLPNKILYEYILVPRNGKFNTNEGAFETTLFKVIVEGSNITDSIENFESNKIAFLTPTLNSGGNSFTKLSFKEKTYDYQGNVISSKNKTHYVQTLDFTELGYKGNKLIETLVFDLKVRATIEFEDPYNTNGDNAICRTNTAFKALINEKI